VPVVVMFSGMMTIMMPAGGVIGGLSAVMMFANT